ncbi:phosphodiesterase/alkaline phosphatase D [Nonlabens ulvanivorans]|uniref:Phosphodiesterase/alkaline phosphatase D n=1 Tax=Nonlabens ulvanivorans TaxID=906888 RepID=A0A090Q9Y1_NONUL|nr:phosphodiesterase/alkaline phosphatase D [Nonlabens ulvanivorans]
MVGYSDFREALIWVQTKAPANVKIGYFTGDEDMRFTETVSIMLMEIISQNYIREKLSMALLTHTSSTLMTYMSLEIIN